MLRYFLLPVLVMGSVCAQTASQPGAPTAAAEAPSSTEDWTKKGQEQLKAGQFQEASQSFEEAVRLDGNNIEAKLGLASACVKLWVTGGKSPLAEESYFRARNTLLAVLDQEPENKKALASLARIALERATSLADRKALNEGLDEARAWNLRLIAIDPGDVAAEYALGVIAWTRCIGPESQSHNLAIVKRSGAAPLATQARLNYQVACREPVEEGIRYLSKVVEADKDSDASMGYLGALYKMKASYEESPEDAQRDRELSNEWTAKAEAAKKSRANSGSPTPQNP